MKEGVSVLEVHPGLRYGMLVMEEEHYAVLGQGATVTALGDGKHSEKSFHYGVSFHGRRRLEADDRCRGADFRTRDKTTDQITRIERRVRARLGPDFDLVREPDHWHLEYDPKKLAL